MFIFLAKRILPAIPEISNPAFPAISLPSLSSIKRRDFNFAAKDIE